MNSSGTQPRKEVRSCCKCIVKERPLKNIKKPDNRLTNRSGLYERKEENLEVFEPRTMDNTCKATITGEINLPANCCLCCGDCGDDDGGGGGVDETDFTLDGNGKSSCIEAYRDLGECLQKCILEQRKKNTNQGYPAYNRSFDLK